MWKISNYSLNYSGDLKAGRLDLVGFLSLCRQYDLEGASLHVRDLPSTEERYLKRLRRAYLDEGLSLSLLSVSTDFARPAAEHEAEMQKARAALRVAAFLGAPLLRVFAGKPRSEQLRGESWDRAVAGVRRVCVEAEKVGIPVGLQNHNHGALCRTGEEVERFIRSVDHPNLTFVLDTGQFAGSRGASGSAPPSLADADYLDSIRRTAPLASYVRTKFYHPAADGSEPWIDYQRVFDALRAVHYDGFLDVVYEPARQSAEPHREAESAIPRAVAFLRRQRQPPAATAEKGTRGRANRYANLSNDRYILDEEVRSEAAVAFLEGPAVDRAGNVFFTNIPAERILRWDPHVEQLTVFRENSNSANGLAFDRKGRLLACETKGRVTRTEMHTGQIEVLADAYEGKPLGAPNDVALDSAGRIYFTSRLANTDPAQGNVNSVYRIDPDGRMQRILALPQIDMPNGIVTSPDDTVLYLIDAHGAKNRARRIRAFELKPSGTVGAERLVYDFYPGRSGDGMAIDAEGNLYIAAGLHRTRGSSETLDTHPGIHVISPQGRLLAFMETPEDTITNCTFGGPQLRTLYITCGKQLLSLRTRIPGKSLYRPQA